MTNKRIKTSARNCDALDASINGAGILSIPHELLLAIARHLGPPIEFLDPMRDNFTGQPSFSMNSQRRQTLHSLSQCCRVLRSFFLPLAWEYFELPPGKRLRTSSRSMVALESKSRALARHPNLAAYVRYEYSDIAEISTQLCSRCGIFQSNIHGDLRTQGHPCLCKVPALAPEPSHPPSHWSLRAACYSYKDCLYASPFLENTHYYPSLQWASHSGQLPQRRECDIDWFSRKTCLRGNCQEM